jgi:hypothetical protein
MAELIRFTKNHQDMSTDAGYQFKFFCDLCGNGFMSPFKENLGNKARSLVRGLGRLAGGVLDQVSDVALEMRRHTMGKAWDEQFRGAIEGVKPYFMQCSRCGKWVCREVCWNLCAQCAPKLEQELAASQSEAELQQMRDKVKQVDFAKDLNVVDRVVAKCPKCGQETSGGKFCPGCGAPLSADKFCTRCGTKVPGGAKFCPGCGDPA